MTLLITGSPRGDAIYRLGYLLLVSWWLLPILTAVATITAIIWMVIDVVMQLLFGSEGWTAGGRGGTVQDWLKRLTYWPWHQIEWAVFGKGMFPWLP